MKEKKNRKREEERGKVPNVSSDLKNKKKIAPSRCGNTSPEDRGPSRKPIGKNKKKEAVRKTDGRGHRYDSQVHSFISATNIENTRI